MTIKRVRVSRRVPACPGHTGTRPTSWFPVTPPLKGGGYATTLARAARNHRR